MTPVRLLALVVGAVLVLVGVLAYVLSGTSSLTAFIPSLVGVLLLICGLLAGRESLRRHALHASAVVALLGFLGAVPNAVLIGRVISGVAQRPAAILSSFIMAVLLLVYLVAAVRSFIQVRRERRLASA